MKGWANKQPIDNKQLAGTYSWWESSGGGQGEAQVGRGFEQVRLVSAGSFLKALMTWRGGKDKNISRE